MTNKIKFSLISPDEPVKSSSLVIGFLILRLIKNMEKVAIFDLYPYIQKYNNSFNYENTVGALIFLYMNELIDFDSPYIYNMRALDK